MRDPLNGYGLTILVFLESADPAFLSTCNFLLYSVYLFNFLLVAFECMADHPSSLISLNFPLFAIAAPIRANPK